MKSRELNTDREAEVYAEGVADGYAWGRDDAATRHRRWVLRLRWRRTKLDLDDGFDDVPIAERVVEDDRLGYRWLRWLRYGERLATDDCEMQDMEMHGPRGDLP